MSEKIEFNKEYRYKELCEVFDMKPCTNRQKTIKAIGKNYLIEKHGAKYVVLKKYTEEEKTQNQNISASLQGRLKQYNKNFNIKYIDSFRGGIYKIYNSQTGEIYIGQTKQFRKRFRQHVGNYDNTTTITHQMIQDGAIMEVIEFIDEDDLLLRLERESFWIDYYRTQQSFKVVNIRKNAIEKQPVPHILVDMEYQTLLEQYGIPYNITYQIKGA